MDCTVTLGMTNRIMEIGAYVALTSTTTRSFLMIEAVPVVGGLLLAAVHSCFAAGFVGGVPPMGPASQVTRTLWGVTRAFETLVAASLMPRQLRYRGVPLNAGSLPVAEP